MLTEIYNHRETITNGGSLQAEDDAVCLELMKKLDLRGQIRFNRSGRNPYDIVSLEQRVVIANLFPRHCEMQEYSGFIPERILYELETAKENFSKVYIAFAPPTIIVDPVVIGTDKKWHDFSIISSIDPMPVKAFLIARWGDALEPWADLYKKAVIKKTRDVTVALDKIQSDLHYAYSKITGGEELPAESLLDSLPTSIRIPHA